MTSDTEILIIGAGLTGLTIGAELSKKNLPFIILEGRDRIGGRIYTKYGETNPPIELGATWLGKKHTALLALIKELNLNIFEQALGERAIYESISTSPPQLVQLGPNEAPSYRIRGGTSSIIQGLAKQIDHNHIKLGQTVNGIYYKDNHVQIKTESQTFIAKKVVTTLPPYLLNETIQFDPPLPMEFQTLAQQTHTWMGESIKVALTYETDFWNTEALSGTIISNVGPIPEMYDHSNQEHSKYALMGFLNGAYFSISKEERLAMILAQLEKYFGPQAHSFINYEEKTWRTDNFTFTDYKQHVLPHQNNGHPLFRKAFWNQHLIIGGAETAPLFPGYMDGAVQSALHCVKQLL